MKKVAHTRLKAFPRLCVCSSLCDVDRLWLPMFAHSSTKCSGPVLMASTHSKTPIWIRHTVSLESQQQLNNKKTPLQWVISYICAPEPFFTEGKQEEEDKGGGKEKEKGRQSRGRSRNGNMLDIWMCLRTTREGKLVHFRINPDKLQICNYTGFRACLLPIHSGISGCVSQRVRA